MALITDPDQILQGTEITIDKTVLNITLNLAGNLSEDGATLQALYSFFKEEWLNEVNDVHKYTFPMNSITPEQFEIGNNGSTFSDWIWANDATRKLIRTAGWREYDSAGTITREYLGAITLGNIDATSKTVGDKAYYAFSSDTSSTEFTYAGPVNEAVQIFGDVNNGNFDKRSDILTLYIRQEGKTYGQSTTTDIGLSTTTYKAERFPLSEANDLKITATDADISTNAPYTGMSITYHQIAQTQNIGGSNYDFGITIDGNNGTAEQIYEFVQWSLRQITDVDSESDAPTQIGNLQDQLLQFVGDSLEALAATNADGGGTGVRITNFDSNDTNRLTFIDNTSASVTFPFVAAGTISFNTNLVNDAAAKYWLFFQRTDFETNTGFGLSAPSANVATLDSSTTDLTTQVALNDYIYLDGFANAANNGIYQVTGTPAGTGPWTAEVTKLDGETLIAETAGPSVTLENDPVNSEDATIINDNSATPITGTVTGQASVSFDFDYDGNTQGGRASSTDADYILRVIGLATAQFAEVSGTITRSVGQNIAITSALERNYVNP